MTISACGSAGVEDIGDVETSTEITINSPDSTQTDNTPALGAAQSTETSLPTSSEVDSPDTPTSEAGSGEPPSSGVETTETQTTEAGTDEPQTAAAAVEEETTETQISEAGTDETQPAETEITASTENLTPVITDSSYNCDPVIDAIGYKVGDTDHFTLSVDDESPLTLGYAVDSSNSDVVNVTVDENGIFTVSAMAPGESYLWLTAEDEHGLVDEYEIWVVVD